MNTPPPKLSEHFPSINDTTIYAFDANSLEKYLLTRPHKFNIIVSYTYWCPTSKFNFTDFVDLQKDTNICLVLFTADDWYYIEHYKNYLKDKHYTAPTFILDIDKYGRGFNPHPKYRKFFTEISKQQVSDIGGFPSYIVMDKDLHLLYAHSGGVDSATYRLLKER